jgi:serine/threonine-protein kinase
MTPVEVLPERVVDRYALYGEIASGGMATVHLGRLIGPVGFARTVAVKCLHPGYAKDPEFVSMFLDEARLAARVRHSNVVATIDVVVRKGELFLVMEYVPGESLATLIRTEQERGGHVPLDYGCTIVSAALHGLHAAHEAVSDRGEPLGLVHRDVSPHNVLVGTDGVARVIDFGVAKAAGRAQTTREGQVKGKMAYMAPEQLLGNVTRRADVYAAGLVLWEVIAGRRTFEADTEPALMARVLHADVEPPSTFVKNADAATLALLEKLDPIVMRAVSRDPEQRYATAEEFAIALEAVVPPAQVREVGAWVSSVGGEALAERLRSVAQVESASAMVAIDRLTARAPPPGSTPADRLSLSSPMSISSPGLQGAGGRISPQAAPQVSPAPRVSPKLLVVVGAAVAVLAVVVIGATLAVAERPTAAANPSIEPSPSASVATSASALAATAASSAPGASGGSTAAPSASTAAAAPSSMAASSASAASPSGGHAPAAPGNGKKNPTTPSGAGTTTAAPSTAAPPAPHPPAHPQNPAFL